jgi:hypothetical protein
VFEGDEQLQLIRDNAEKSWQAVERENCSLVEAKLWKGAKEVLEDAGVKVFDHAGILSFLQGAPSKPKPKFKSGKRKFHIQGVVKDEEEE